MSAVALRHYAQIKGSRARAHQRRTCVKESASTTADKTSLVSMPLAALRPTILPFSLEISFSENYEVYYTNTTCVVSI